MQNIYLILEVLKMLEKLGFKQTNKLLIINADDFGITQAANQAISELFNRQAITSTSVIMPSLFSKEVRNLLIETSTARFGIHLALTDSFKPVSRPEDVRTLITNEGFFAASSEYIELNGDIDQVKHELRNQIELALSLGINPTHLDSHQGSVFGLYHGKDFMKVVFELCLEYGLPFLLPRQVVNETSFSDRILHSFKRYIEMADALGIVLIDDLICLPYALQEDEDYEAVKTAMMDKLRQIKPGITQVTIHPSFINDNIKTTNPHWRKREMEYYLFLDDEIKALLLEEDIKLISWKEVRDYQRLLKSIGCNRLTL
jgi:predicted glycoside hydrolase/deacetylase ChbG (UPF0249 family)